MTEGIPSSNRFRDGMKFGAGFSLIFLVSYIIAGVLVTIAERQINLATLHDVQRTYGPSAGLEILHHDSVQTPGNVVVRGRLRNGGKDTWDWVQLQVDLLDEGGQFVALCEGRCLGLLHAGQERNFSVDCKGSSESPVPAFKRYTIEVVDASWKASSRSEHDGA